MRTVLVASDAPTVRAEVASVTLAPDIEVVEVASGPEVIDAVRREDIDLVVVDMQMGNMGGMAVCLDLRLEESYTDLGHVPVLMLLDRRPDVFLARRSGAEGWLVKPLDPLRLRRAVAALLADGHLRRRVVSTRPGARGCGPAPAEHPRPRGRLSSPRQWPVAKKPSPHQQHPLGARGGGAGGLVGRPSAPPS